MMPNPHTRMPAPPSISARALTPADEEARVYCVGEDDGPGVGAGIGTGVGNVLSVGTGDGTLPLKYPAPLPHEQHMSEDVKSSSSE